MTEAAQAKRSVVIEHDFPHSPEKVWRAITEGALIEQWLMKNDFQPVVGHRFKLRMAPMGNWDGVIDGEVLEVEPNKRLSYGWSSLGLDTVVTFTLTPTNAGVRVRMEQAGFGPDQEANYQGAAYGWQQFIGNLETVVAGL